MRAVTFQSPGEVRVSDRPEPELQARDDAIVSIEASGICGSDLHIYHGRVKIEPGFTIGHEFVGTVLSAGDDVTRVSPGDRVLGCFHSACGTCFYCLRGAFAKCDRMRVNNPAHIRPCPIDGLVQRQLGRGRPDAIGCTIVKAACGKTARAV